MYSYIDTNARDTKWLSEQAILTPQQLHWVTCQHENINFQDRLWPRCTSGEENPGSTRTGDSTGASQVDLPECNSPSSVPVTGQPALWTEEMARALIDCYERSEPQRRGYLKRLEWVWLSKYPHLPQTGRTLACQAKRNFAGDRVLQVTGSQDLDLVNDAP